MTVKELFDFAQTPIEVKSGYNGKILCKRYSDKKHTDVSERVITSLWSEIRATSKNSYSSFAMPVICVYVSGGKEYDDTHKEASI